MSLRDRISLLIAGLAGAGELLVFGAAFLIAVWR